MAFHSGIHEQKGTPLGIWLGLMLDEIPEALVIVASLIHSWIFLLAGRFYLTTQRRFLALLGSFSVILLMWASFNANNRCT